MDHIWLSKEDPYNDEKLIIWGGLSKSLSLMAALCYLFECEHSYSRHYAIRVLSSFLYLLYITLNLFPPSLVLVHILHNQFPARLFQVCT